MGATSSCTHQADDAVINSRSPSAGKTVSSTKSPTEKFPVGRGLSAEEDEWETELPSAEYRLQRGEDPLASTLIESKRLRNKAQESTMSCCGSTSSAKRQAKAITKSKAQLLTKLEGMLGRAEAFAHVFQTGDPLGFALTQARYAGGGDSIADTRNVRENSTTFGRRCAAVDWLEAKRPEDISNKNRYYPHGTLPMPTDTIVCVDNEPLPLDLDVVQFAKLQARLKNSGRPLRLVFLPGMDRDDALKAETERHSMRLEDLADRDTGLRARARSYVAIATEAAGIAGRSNISAQDRLDAVSTAFRAARNAERLNATRISSVGGNANSPPTKIMSTNNRILVRKESDDTAVFLQESAHRAAAAAQRGLQAALKLVTGILLERGELARSYATSARKEADLTMGRKHLLEATLSVDDDVTTTTDGEKSNLAATSTSAALTRRIPSPSTTATVFEPGDRVRVCGLRKATSFNERVGIVKELDEETHRILVHFDDGGIVSVRAINLCPHDTDSADKSLAVGSRIVITGLRSQLDFNGQEGTVSHFDAKTMRYYVSTDKGQQAALKPGNLEVIAKQTGSPAAFQSSIRQKAKRAALSARKATEASKELSKWVAALNMATNGRATTPSGSPGSNILTDSFEMNDENLFNPGDAVVLVGVAMFPQLNGARCCVKEWENRRYVVEREDTGNSYSAEACILVAPDNGGDAAAQSRELTAAARREAKAAKAVSQQAAAAFPMYDQFSPASRVSSININDIADLDDLGIDDDASLHGDTSHHDLFEDDEDDFDDDDDFSRDDDFSILPSDYIFSAAESGDDDDMLEARMSADIEGAVCPVDGRLSYSPGMKSKSSAAAENTSIQEVEDIKEEETDVHRGDDEEPEDFYEEEIEELKNEEEQSEYSDLENDGAKDQNNASDEIRMEDFSNDKQAVEDGEPGYFYDAELAKSCGVMEPEDSDIDAAPERQLSSEAVSDQRHIDHIDEPPLEIQVAKPDLTDAVSEPTVLDSPQPTTRHELPEAEEPSSEGLTRERLRQLDLLSGTPPGTPFGTTGTVGQPFGDQAILTNAGGTGDLLDFDASPTDRRQARSNTRLSHDLLDLNDAVEAQAAAEHAAKSELNPPLPRSDDLPIVTSPLATDDGDGRTPFFIENKNDSDDEKAHDSSSSYTENEQREDPRTISTTVEAIIDMESDQRTTNHCEEEVAAVRKPGTDEKCEEPTLSNVDILSGDHHTVEQHDENFEQEEPPAISLDASAEATTHMVTPDFRDEEEEEENSQEETPWSNLIKKPEKNTMSTNLSIQAPPELEEEDNDELQREQDFEDDSSSLSSTTRSSVNSKREPAGSRRKTNELLDHPIFARQKETTTSPNSRVLVATPSSASIEPRPIVEAPPRDLSKRSLAATYENSLATRREEARKLKEQQTAAAAAAARSEIEQRIAAEAAAKTPSSNQVDNKDDEARLSPVVEFNRYDTDDEVDLDDDEEEGQLVTPMTDDFFSKPPPTVSDHETNSFSRPPRPLSEDERPPPSMSSEEEAPLQSISYDQAVRTPRSMNTEPLGRPMSYDEAVGRSSTFTFAAASPIIEFNVVDDEPDENDSKPPIARSVNEEDLLESHDSKAKDVSTSEDDSILNTITSTLFGWSTDPPPSPVKEAPSIRESSTTATQ